MYLVFVTAPRPTCVSARARVHTATTGYLILRSGTVSVMLCTGTAPPLPPPPLQAAAAALVRETLPSKLQPHLAPTVTLKEHAY